MLAGANAAPHACVMCYGCAMSGLYLMSLCLFDWLSWVMQQCICKQLPARQLSLGCGTQVMDLGSLNGTTLNGRIISTSNRRRGRLWRLNDGDQLQLGVHSGIKITYLPLADATVGLPALATWRLFWARRIKGSECSSMCGTHLQGVTSASHYRKALLLFKCLKCLASIPNCRPSFYSSGFRVSG